MADRWSNEYVLNDPLGEGDIKRLINETAKAGETVEWIIHHYTSGWYDGDGTLIARLSNGLYLHMELSHCSCYGPLEGGEWEWYSAETVKHDLNLMDLPSPDQVAVNAKWREVELPE